MITRHRLALCRPVLGGLLSAWLIPLFLPVLSLKAADVRVNSPSKDESLSRDVAAVCMDVVGVFEKKVGKPPALGTKPFVIQQAPDDAPRAVINDLPKEYRINLTCLNTRFYQQITYQLAHELTHHYVNPYKSNWFVESMAMAQSLLILTDMGDKWATNAPYANWKPAAHRFAEYRAATVSNQLVKLNLTQDQVPAWIRTDLPRLVTSGKVDRPEQTACALVIEEAFKRHPKTWGAICQLGAATEKDGNTDFGKWESLVSSEDRPLVRELATTFAFLLSDAKKDKASNKAAP
jgi:hypothetical protein